MLNTILVLTCILQQPVEVPQESPWTRRAETETLVSLELVSKRYTAEGKPDLWLIGVAHVADESFYDDITILLDELDVVLYESVRPSGARPPSGVTEEEKIKTTNLSVNFVADIAEEIFEVTDELPSDLEELIADSTLLDRRMSGWVEDASVDAWGRPFVLQVHEESSGLAFTIWSFGKDGNSDDDNIFSTRHLVSKNPIATEGEFITIEENDEQINIQQELADALGLEFQLDALPYEEPNWFCSDLTIDEVQEKMEEKGVDSIMLDTLTGESMMAKLTSGMMKLLPLLDALAGGGVKETARLLMIEMLSMPGSDQLIDSAQPNLMEVIIIDRNTELLKDVAATLDVVEDVTTIGVLYGAGHMPDLEKRIDVIFGYEPVEERWFKTMSVNPKESLLDENDLKRMRFTLRYQMYKATEASKKENEKESETKE